MAYIVRPDTIGTIIASLDQRVYSLETYRGNNPCGRLWGAGSQSISDSTETQISLGNTSFLQGGMTTSGSNLIVPISGYYSVHGVITSAGGGTSGAWNTKIHVGSNVDAQAKTPCSASGGYGPAVSDIVYASASTAIGLYCFQNSGAAISTYAAGTASAFIYLTVALVSA